MFTERGIEGQYITHIYGPGAVLAAARSLLNKNAESTKNDRRQEIGGERARAWSGTLKGNMTLATLDLRGMSQQSKALQGNDVNKNEQSRQWNGQRRNKCREAFEGQHSTGNTGRSKRATKTRQPPKQETHQQAEMAKQTTGSAMKAQER